MSQSGDLVNAQLQKFLAPAGYYKLVRTPRLWRHVTRPIQFTLVVDDFVVKYVGQEHSEHLINTIKKHYEVSEYWEEKIYCGIPLDWNYKAQTMDISMPG